TSASYPKDTSPASPKFAGSAIPCWSRQSRSTTRIGSNYREKQRLRSEVRSMSWQVAPGLLRPAEGTRAALAADHRRAVPAEAIVIATVIATVTATVIGATVPTAADRGEDKGRRLKAEG